MVIKSAEYFTTASSPEGYPIQKYQEFVFLGRSNVGKSTFINHLLSRKNLARISTTPGKTRALNFYLINSSFFLVDVPGYGYARVSKTEKKKFGKMVEEYLTTRSVLNVATLLIDFKVGPTEDDILMYDFLKFHQIPTVIVATKKDKIKKSQYQKHVEVLQKKINFQHDDIFFTYSKNDRDSIEIIKNYFKKICAV